MKKNYTIVTLGSHSALDICRGAKDLGFETLVIAQKGRAKTYNEYYKTRHVAAQRGTGWHPSQPGADWCLGCVDECIILDKFSDILNRRLQQKLKKRNIIFIPHRSFEVYLNFDYQAIENEFKIAIFGNKYLLKIEERGTKPNQYNLLQKAEIKFPKQFSNPAKIDSLCLVKVLEKERGFERAFFLVKDYQDFQKQTKQKLQTAVFTQDQLENAIIEEFVIGVQVNFNFFYSPIFQRLELLGTDTRRQTNIEGINRLPAQYQSQIMNTVSIQYEETGHIAVTVLESLLEDAFELGEKFVKASQKMFPPGIVGPFSLQSIITPGPPKKEIVVIDVSPRMPGSPGIAATPYSSYLFGQQISVGKRIAMEIQNAIELDCLNILIT